MTSADPPNSDPADATTPPEPPTDTVAADTPEQAYRDVTDEEHVVMCSLKHGLTTTRAVTRHTLLRSRDIHGYFLQLEDSGLIIFEKPESWLAAQNDDRHRPIKEATLTTAGHGYYEWAVSNTRPVFHAYTHTATPDGRTRDTPEQDAGERVDSIDQRLTTLERIVREEWMDEDGEA